MKKMSKVLSLVAVFVMLASLAFASVKCATCGVEMADDSKMVTQTVDGKDVSVCEVCAAATAQK